MTAMIISIGGTPDPIARSIREYRPGYVCFLASESSAGEIQSVARILNDLPEPLSMPDNHIVQVNNPQDLTRCYQGALECIHHLVNEGHPADSVIVDFTGGTKCMSAALSLATVSSGCRFSYVGGARRTKNGLGIVINGSEEVVNSLSPWALFAVEERRSIIRLFNACQYEAASQLAAALVQRQVSGAG